MLLLSFVRSAAADGHRLANSVCSGLFAAETSEQAFAIHEIKAWFATEGNAKKLFGTEVDGDSPSSSSTTGGVSMLVDTLVRILLKLLDDDDVEHYILLRIIDLIASVAQRCRVGPVLRLALAQFVDSENCVEPGLRAKTAQVRRVNRSVLRTCLRAVVADMEGRKEA